MKMPKLRFLFLADVKDSSALPEPGRSVTFERLKQALEVLNATYKPDLGLALNYGDEVAGLFSSPIHCFSIASGLRDALYPDTTLRFVVTRGEIGNLNQDITQIGGPIFKEAASLIEDLKKQRRFSAWSTGDPLHDQVLTALSESSNRMLENMTAFQRQVFLGIRAEQTHQEIADALGKKRQQVSLAVKSSGTESVLENEAAIQKVLEAWSPS